MQLGREKYSFSKKIKNNVKKAVRFIGDFEKTASELAIENNFDYVICGHIHQPQIREIETKNGRCTYLNSGDWIENLTALEYYNSKWTLFTYDKKMFEENKDFELDPYEQQTIEMLIKDVINF